MEQMLSKMLALQDAWFSDSVYVRPLKLRLQQELRRKRLKCEFDFERDTDADTVVCGMGSVGGVLLEKAKSLCD